MAELIFHAVAKAADIAEGDMLRVQIGDLHIALYKLGGRIYATQALCTHGLALLTDGWVKGCTVECPMHNGKFDIPSGAATGAPCVAPLETYPVTVEAGEVRVGMRD